MKNAKKLDVKMLAIWLIVLVAFVAVVFLLPIARNTVFYIAFAMTLVSFGLVAFAYVQSFLHDDALSSKVLGFPIFRVSIFALVIQVVVFAALSVLSVVAPVWLALLIEGLVLVGTSVCLIATEAARGVVEEAEVHLADKTKMLKKLRAQAETAMALQEDAKVKNEVEKLAQALRFADPVSSDAAKDIEAQIEELLGKICVGSAEERMICARQAFGLVQKRNRIVKSDK